MQLIIPDAVLNDAGLTPKDVLIELACRLFDIDRLGLSMAAQLAGLTRAEFESELRKRGIPAYRPTLDEFRRDAAALGLDGHAA